MGKYFKKFNLDKLLKYGIAAILIAVPLYPKFPFLKVPGIYVSIRIEDFLIFVVSLIWFVKILPQLNLIFKNRILRAMMLFLATALVATLSGIIFLHTVSAVVGILEWGRRVEYLIGFFIAVTTIKSTKDIEFYVKCIGVVLIIVFVFGFGQKYFNFPVITTQNQEYSKGIALRYVTGGHLASTFAGHYDMSTYLILVTPIFTALYFVVKEKKLKFIIFLLIAISFWLLANGASRISEVSYMISMCITLALIRKYKYIPVVVIASVIFIFSTSSLFNRYLNIFDVIKNKITLIPTAYAPNVNPVPAQPQMAVLEDRSTSIRLNVEWPRAIRAFLKNPLLGTGYSSITLATDNDYLRILGELGILGVISTFFVFYRIIRSLPMKQFKELNFKNAYLAGIIGAIPGILLNALFIDVFEASKFAIAFWFLLGFAVVLALNYEKKTN